MILSGQKILSEIQAGNIRITPFDEKYVNPISVDLTLGKHVAVYRNAISGVISNSALWEPSHNVLDPKVEQPIIKRQISESGFVMNPGIGYLMHTNENVWTEKYVPILDGKSSVGRLFIQIHATAGLGDPGFDGQYTLEVMVTHPVKVYEGMRIAQIRFFTIDGGITSYQRTGNYVGEKAQGPIGSMLWKSFK